ncbi:hypothetical protein DFJ73DRAFT_826168 [Zopfochytrium polystomum]|nr:hypothetical protein DFJ73DRAFT_826168 [Zopfochytrium polystomum]
MRSSLFTLLASFLLWGSSIAINTGARRGKWFKGSHIPPTDFTRLDASGTFDLGSTHGRIVRGPFVVENATNGELYSFGSLKEASGKTSCFLTRLYGRSNRYTQAKTLGHKHRHHFVHSNCTAFDATIHPSSRAYFAVGVTESGPFLLKIVGNGAAIDWRFAKYLRKDLKGLLPTDVDILSAAVTVDETSGDVVTVWNFPEGIPSSVIRWSAKKDISSVIMTLPNGFMASSPGGIVATPKGDLIVGGTTTKDLAGKSHTKHLFVNEYDLSKGSPELAKHTFWTVHEKITQNIGVESTNVVYDTTDGSIYIGGSTQIPFTSVMFKLETTAPFSTVTQLKRRKLPGKVNSIAAIHGSFSYAAVTDGTGHRQLFTFDYLLPNSTVVRATKGSLGDAGSNFHITTSEFHPGTLVAGTAAAHPNYAGTADAPQTFRLGATTDRVLIIHRVTRQALTQTGDGGVHLFPIEKLPGDPADPPTLNQQWDMIPGTKSIRNAATGQALTIRGHPNVVWGYDQEVGHKIVGDAYRMAATQRWSVNKDHTITNLLDTRCIGLDREYLRNNRFPGKAGKHGNTTWYHFTGLPVVTVYCIYDKLILWDVVPVV